jgi:hypothetical protein
LGRNPKSGEPHVAGVVDEDIRGLDILMYEASLVDLTECSCQTNGGIKKTSQLERLPLVTLKNSIQRLTARVLEYEYRPPFVTSKSQRLGRPRGIEFGCERVFVYEPADTLRRRLFRESDREDWRGVVVLSAAVKGKIRAFPKGHQHVPRGPRDW